MFEQALALSMAQAPVRVSSEPNPGSTSNPTTPITPPSLDMRSDNYQGLTNEEDFKQVESAKVVHIISTPWITNVPAANKAHATKMYWDNAEAGVYVFNPNSGLRAAANASGMSEEEQGKKWLQLWTNVLHKVQETHGTCFVMAKGTDDDHKLEGNAQQGELNVARGFKVNIEFVFY